MSMTSTDYVPPPMNTVAGKVVPGPPLSNITYTYNVPYVPRQRYGVTMPSMTNMIIIGTTLLAIYFIFQSVRRSQKRQKRDAKSDMKRDIRKFEKKIEKSNKDIKKLTKEIGKKMEKIDKKKPHKNVPMGEPV